MNKGKKHLLCMRSLFSLMLTPSSCIRSIERSNPAVPRVLSAARACSGQMVQWLACVA